MHIVNINLQYPTKISSFLGLKKISWYQSLFLVQPGSVSRSTCWLTSTANSSSSLFWPLQEVNVQGAHTLVRPYIYNKIEKSKKIKNLSPFKLWKYFLQWWISKFFLNHQLMVYCYILQFCKITVFTDYCLIVPSFSLFLVYHCLCDFCSCLPSTDYTG